MSEEIIDQEGVEPAEPKAKPAKKRSAKAVPAEPTFTDDSVVVVEDTIPVAPAEEDVPLTYGPAFTVCLFCGGIGLVAVAPGALAPCYQCENGYVRV